MVETREELLLIQHEGMRLYPYNCPAGKLTIGVGRNIEDNGITREEALFMLRNDMKRCRKELADIGIVVDGARGAALANMLFNLGLTRFCKFQKMLKAIDIKDWKEAARQMLDSNWAKQVGERAQVLAEMVETNLW